MEVETWQERSGHSINRKTFCVAGEEHDEVALEVSLRAGRGVQPTFHLLPHSHKRMPSPPITTAGRLRANSDAHPPDASVTCTTRRPLFTPPAEFQSHPAI